MLSNIPAIVQSGVFFYTSFLHRESGDFRAHAFPMGILLRTSYLGCGHVLAVAVTAVMYLD